MAWEPHEKATTVKSQAGHIRHPAWPAPPRRRSSPDVHVSRVSSSANSTVTCLYSAWVTASLTGEPQLWQNRAFCKGSVPHVRHAATVVIRPSADPGPRFSQDRRLDTPPGAVGFTVGDDDTKI